MRSSDTPAVLTLWATPHSLYSGKVRSYLLKKGIPFCERTLADPEFHQDVVPTVGHLVVPVVRLPDGRVVQDSVDIVDALEAIWPQRPMIPTAPLQKVAALLLDGFGLQGLLPAAMHYRWTYREDQELFLQAEFGRGLITATNRDERRAAGAKLMEYFSGMLPLLGVNPAAVPAIEAATDELWDALDEHFQHLPYLLGGHPSIADFGFIAPLFAHLGRDPVPASRMKKRAPNVFRWVERMNLPGIVDPEFAELQPTWPTEDTLPATLEPVLRLLFDDWGPMLKTDAEAYNDWLVQQPEPVCGRLISHDGTRKVHPTTGMVRMAWRGCEVMRASAPHGLWLLARAQAALATLNAGVRTRLDAMLDRVGGREVMSLQLARPIRRENNVLVVG